jgi:hypothetical protein
MLNDELTHARDRCDAESIKASELANIIIIEARDGAEAAARRSRAAGPWCPRPSRRIVLLRLRVAPDRIMMKSI